MGLLHRARQRPATGNDMATVSFANCPFKCPVVVNLLLPCHPQSTTTALPHLPANHAGGYSLEQEHMAAAAAASCTAADRLAFVTGTLHFLQGCASSMPPHQTY